MIFLHISVYSGIVGLLENREAEAEIKHTVPLDADRQKILPGYRNPMIFRCTFPVNEK